MIRFLLTICFLTLLSCGQKSAVPVAPPYHPLSLQWAQYSLRYPGGAGAETAEGRKAGTRALQLEQSGYELYLKKKDHEAVARYEQAIKLRANSELYFRYGNSLSNIGKLHEAIQAYQLAGVLQYEKKDILAYNHACACSRAGRIILAQQFLIDAIKNGYTALEHMLTDPDLANLRNNATWTTFRDETLIPAMNSLKDKSFLDTLKQHLDAGQYNAALNLVRCKNESTNTRPLGRAEIYVYYLNKRNIPACRFLIENILNPNDTYGIYQSPLLSLTIGQQQEELVILLLNRGADIHGIPRDPHTPAPLITAAQTGNIRMVRTLLSRGVNPDSRFPGSYTALALAAFRQDIEMAKFLLASHADPDTVIDIGESPFTIAIKSKNDALIRIFNAARKHNSNIIFLQLFQQRYCGRKLVCRAINRVFTFTPGHDFTNNGVGTFRLTELHKQNHMFEQGTFRIRGNQMELVRRMSYMQFALKFIIQPIDALRIRINGDIFQMETP